MVELKNSVNDNATDADIIDSVAAGDADAFETLVRKYERRVLSTAYRYVGDSTAAEDVAQEVFIKVWRNAKRFKGKSSFSTWLYRIVVNQCLNYREKRKRAQTAPLNESIEAAGLSPDEEYEREKKNRLVRTAVDELPGRQRMALLLSKFEGRSYAEIAEIMKVSLSSVESLIFRAKQNLKSKLGPLIEKGYV